MVIAVLVLGPDKLPEALVKFAKFFKYFKAQVSSAKSNFEQEVRIAELKADAAKLYATKTYVGTIPSTYTEQKDVIAYINKKAEETLAAAQGGSSETVASVKQQLDSYKNENLAKFEKLEGIETGAQVNKLEGVKLNGTEL